MNNLGDWLACNVSYLSELQHDMYDADEDIDTPIAERGETLIVCRDCKPLPGSSASETIAKHIERIDRENEALRNLLKYAIDVYSIGHGTIGGIQPRQCREAIDHINARLSDSEVDL